MLFGYLASNALIGFVGNAVYCPSRSLLASLASNALIGFVGNLDFELLGTLPPNHSLPMR